MFIQLLTSVLLDISENINNIDGYSVMITKTLFYLKNLTNSYGMFDTDVNSDILKNCFEIHLQLLRIVAH